MNRRHPNVVNVLELEPRTMEKGNRFGLTTRRLGMSAGGTQIGCSWYELPPGRTAFPRHFHCANEEAIFVLDGEGTVRIGDAEVKIGSGDYAAFPAGPEHAHQVVNTGKVPLRYLAFSSMHPTDVVGYPDSKKFGAVGAGAPGQPWIRELFRSAPLDYYDGERID